MTPRNFREAHVQGVQMATRLHKELASSERLAEIGNRVDVFRSIDDRGFALLFRPLDGLLGLCLREPYPGVLVTTKRSLSVQRFTAAHELGHLEMGHDFSLDDEEQIRRPHGSSQKKLQEIAANAFGAEFLMPKWLLRKTMERHGWEAGDLTNPLVVYQLSLRIGVSYEAMCVSLLRHTWVEKTTADSLLKTSPKAIKAHLLDGELLEDPWADVWSLTAADHNGTVDAAPKDVFMLNLKEHGGGGFLWNVEDLARLGFIVNSHDATPTTEAIGAPLTRCWQISATGPSEGSLRIKERRPWQVDDVIGQFVLNYRFWGKETGIPRFQRELLRAA